MRLWCFISMHVTLEGTSRFFSSLPPSSLVFLGVRSNASLNMTTTVFQPSSLLSTDLAELLTEVLSPGSEEVSWLW